MTKLSTDARCCLRTMLRGSACTLMGGGCPPQHLWRGRWLIARVSTASDAQIVKCQRRGAAPEAQLAPLPQSARRGGISVIHQQ